MRTRRRFSSTAIIALLLQLGCRDATGPVVELQLRGTVTHNGAALPGARVVLQDRRTAYEAGVVLQTATTDATGKYALNVRAERPGYAPGCAFLVLFVENYQYSTVGSTPIQCASATQTIDLVVTD